MIIEINDITDLFDEFYLIEEKPVETLKEKENPPKINFKGGNGKGLVFVFGHVLTPADQDMIDKLIHNALKIKMEDIALVDLAGQNITELQQVIEIMQPKHVVLWGSHSLFPPAVAMYTVEQTGKVRFVKVDEVNRFHNDIPLKTSLWNSIQQLLNG